MLCLARVCCATSVLWHCPLPCTAWCAKPDPDPDSPGRCGLAGCRLQSGAPCVSRAIRIQIERPIRRAGPGAPAGGHADTAPCTARPKRPQAPDSPQIPARYYRIWLQLRPSPVTGIKTRGRPGPGQGPAWSCIYCKRLAPLPSQSTSTGRPGQQVVQVAGVHHKSPPDLPQAPGHPPSYEI